MVIYADTLLVTNLIVDFFLLKVTFKILKNSPRSIRIFLSAVTGAIFSLYIFLPSLPFLLDLLVRLSMNSVMILIAIGFKSPKGFFRTMALHFIVTCVYGGAMTALWQLLKPRGMVINNSVVYFNISPIVLIITTVTGYFLYIMLSKIFALPSSTAKRCSVTLYALGSFVGVSAIVDTGNSITDILTGSEVIIADRAVAAALFGDLDLNNPLLSTRFRSIPCNTVSGNSLLEGFRCDKAEIKLENTTYHLVNPILAISKLPIKEDYSAIINPQIFKTEGIKNEPFKTITK